MQQREIDALGADLLSVPSLPRKPPLTEPDTVIVGFDSEFVSGMNRERPRLLSLQFAIRSPSGVVSRVYYPPDGPLTPVVLVSFVVQFLQDVACDVIPVKNVRRVVLVAHYAAAELSVLDDAIRDVIIRPTSAKGHHARIGTFNFGTEDEPQLWEVRISDLYAFFHTSLAEIGRLVGLDKLDIDPTTLEDLIRTDVGQFMDYAARDAEIAVLAFERWRDVLLAEWGIDLLMSSTTAGVAVEIMRRRFIGIPPVPTRKERVFRNRRRKNGWVSSPTDIDVFDGDKALREVACRSYSGGRVEAFARGLIVGPVVERDVSALYPSATILQPLPNARTKWRSATDLREVQEMEGVGRFCFSFPRTELYPCLPVTREGVARLTFPRTGESYCTFAEVRAAIELGADVAVVKASGFVPTRLEHDHDFGKYMRHFIDRKNASTKDTLEYETNKLLMNALIGKLGERIFESHLLELERFGRNVGVQGLGAAFAGSSRLRQSLRSAPRVGKLWLPEHAALITGKARALMATITARGAHVISTDAVIGHRDTDYMSTGLRELQGAGSDLIVKHEGDALFIARGRLYAILQRSDQIRPGATVLAQDEYWVVVRVARHGTTESKQEFAKTVLRCLAARRDVAESHAKTRLLSAEAAVREGLEINESITVEGQTYWTWDGKRALVDRDVNPFSSWTRTTPYSSLSKLEAAEHERGVRRGRRRRKVHPLTQDQYDDAIRLLLKGGSVREIAEKTGISKSTAGRIRGRVFKK
ncbi:MAG: hypothetical protein KF764_00960 [Labilithrix sp.]|nr:hypothetical protein [Labilithrix sp.]